MLLVETYHSKSIYLRPADATDVQRFYAWRNDPWIISKGRSQKKVAWLEHSEWFLKAIIDQEQLIYVVLVDHSPAGAMFFSKDGKVASVSLYFLEKFTGRGMGAPIIQTACAEAFKKWSDLTEIHALVLHHNQPSKSVFIKSDFKQMHNDGDCELYCLSRSENQCKIPHNCPAFDCAEVSAASDAVASGMWVNGNWTQALEDRLSRLMGSKAVTVSSGFTALKFALRIAGVKAGSEVIVPAYSCVAIPNAIRAIGAKPVAVDVDSLYSNITVKSVLGAINDATVAVIAVNTFGAKADWENLKEKTGITLIEDGSHGFEVGDCSWKLSGDIGIMSFYATKLIGSGQGGVIWLKKDCALEAARDLRSYADKPVSAERENGYMSDMESAIAYRQLDKFDSHMERRAELAKYYQSELQQTNTLKLPNLDRPGVHYRYVIRCDSRLGRKALQRALAEQRIVAEKPVELWLSKQELQRCSNAREGYGKNISLPLYPSLKDEQAQRVVAVIKKELGN